MPKVKTDKTTILKKALEVFYQQGYYPTTLSDLAAACDIEKPHFYYYFGSKKELMEEVLRYIHGVVERMILNKAYNPNYTPKERLNIMMNNLQKLQLVTYSGCIMGNTVLETYGTRDDFRPVLQPYFNGWIDALSNIYATRFSESKSRVMAKEDLESLQGSMMFMKLYDDEQYLLDCIQKIRNRI